MSIYLSIYIYTHTNTHHGNKLLYNKSVQRFFMVIMKTMCPPGYHHSGFMATHALRHMMYCAHLAIVRFEHSVCR